METCTTRLLVLIFGLLLNQSAAQARDRDTPPEAGPGADLNGTVLVLNIETGENLARVEVQESPDGVSWSPLQRLNPP